MKKGKAVHRSRRSREQWLEAALQALSRQGGARIRVRDVSAELGVTTGSFYRHFSGRADFVRSLVKYWRSRYTTEIIERVRRSGDDAKTRLLTLAIGIIEEGLAQYDVPVRMWATQEPGLAALVRQVDQERLSVLREIFTELGFRGPNVDMRARTFVAYYGLEPFLHVRQSKRERLAEARCRIELLTQPLPRDGT